jgi:GT2 family glycosyltransferase
VLADIHASRAWRILAWLRRLRQALRLSRPSDQPSGARVFVTPLACQPLLPQGLVSIILPFRDQPELLRNCLRSLRRTRYRRFEIVLIDNGSVEARTIRLLDRLQGRRSVSVVRVDEPFNFARLCNAGARRARGDYLLFLNNDTEVLTPSWLDQMLLVARQERVGVVGATLYYPDGAIQHAGLAEWNGIWFHPHRGVRPGNGNSPAELQHVRTVRAVSAACMLVGRQLFHELGGFDERFAVTQNDTDFCRRVWDRGQQVAITPHAQLRHYESLTRGYDKEPAA